MRSHCFVAVFLFALMPAAGCGKKSNAVSVQPVSGQVLYAGEPAAGVQVYFMPLDAPAIPQIPANPRGVTGPDGRFTLTTFTEGDGAAIGTYQIALMWPRVTKGARSESEEDRLLGWYGGVHSKLRAEVKEGENTIPPIRLSAVSYPPAELEGIPGKN